jgi:hypothetical protein
MPTVVGGGELINRMNGFAACPDIYILTHELYCCGNRASLLHAHVFGTNDVGRCQICKYAVDQPTIRVSNDCTKIRTKSLKNNANHVNFVNRKAHFHKGLGIGTVPPEPKVAGSTPARCILFP